MLTAAHCVTGAAGATAHFHVSGSGYNTEPSRQISSWAYPDYYGRDDYHGDVAVLELASPVTTISPPALSFERETWQELSFATVVGRGETETGATSPELMRADVVRVPLSECIDGSDDAWDADDVHSDLCAGGDGVDSCRGDSGGPLLDLSHGKEVLLGVVSRGAYPCSRGYPGIYSSLASYPRFIATHVPDISVIHERGLTIATLLAKNDSVASLVEEASGGNNEAELAVVRIVRAMWNFFLRLFLH
jgi:secreted trypsin-like serine protease